MKPKANITPAIRLSVIDWLDHGETRQQLATRLGISLGSVDRILTDERARRRGQIPENHRLAKVVEMSHGPVRQEP